MVTTFSALSSSSWARTDFSSGSKARFAVLAAFFGAAFFGAGAAASGRTALAARLALRSAVLVTPLGAALAVFAFAGVLDVLGVLAGRGLGLR